MKFYPIDEQKYREPPSMRRRFQREFEPILGEMSKDMHAFVMFVVRKLCPEYFLTAPASLSGKYHPSFDLGHKGLVRHTKCAVWWGRHWARFLDSDPDEATAALLMHDMWTCGPDWEPGKEKDRDLTITHGGLFADKLEELCQGYDFLRNHEAVKRVIYAIGGHMSKWTHPDYIHYTVASDDPKGRLLLTVQFADYSASRKFDTVSTALSNEAASQFLVL